MAVGSNLGSSGLRNNGFGPEFGGGQEKGEREAGWIYNGLSQQPKPMGAVGRIKMMIAGTGTPEGILSGHWEVIGSGL